MKKKKISSSRAAIPVRALDFVMYNSKNIRGARAFYQKLFGLKRGSEWNDFWSEFATQPLTFCLNGTGHKRHPEWNWSGPACVALAVDDVRAAIDVCRKHRVEVLIEPVETSFAGWHGLRIRMATGFASIRSKMERRDKDYALPDAGTVAAAPLTFLK